MASQNLMFICRRVVSELAFLMSDRSILSFEQMIGSAWEATDLAISGAIFNLTLAR